MGKGNQQRAQQKRERNMKKNATSTASSQLKANEKALTIVCSVCKVPHHPSALPLVAAETASLWLSSSPHPSSCPRTHTRTHAHTHTHTHTHTQSKRFSAPQTPRPSKNTPTTSIPRILSLNVSPPCLPSNSGCPHQTRRREAVFFEGFGNLQVVPNFGWVKMQR